MAKIKILKPITFDGVKQQQGTILEMSAQRLATMIENFKKQNLNGHLYIEVLEVEQEPVKKTRAKRKK
jgi:hypothetical protein